MTEHKLNIPEHDYQALVKTCRSVLGIREGHTKRFLQDYLQQKYDDLVAGGEDSGDIQLQLPTPEILIKWIKSK